MARRGKRRPGDRHWRRSACSTPVVAAAADSGVAVGAFKCFALAAERCQSGRQQSATHEQPAQGWQPGADTSPASGSVADGRAKPTRCVVIGFVSKGCGIGNGGPSHADAHGSRPRWEHWRKNRAAAGFVGKPDGHAALAAGIQPTAGQHELVRSAGGSRLTCRRDRCDRGRRVVVPASCSKLGCLRPRVLPLSFCSAVP
mmetsp:Transcript_58369/g.162707  ORF Transcript_58369/g.162707 Transcript_58369/m.162707 type:complete len:200 (+) Transcript_58369:413-1012(+)